MNQNCSQKIASPGLKISPKMRLRLGLCPGPHWGSLQRSPRPPNWRRGRGMGEETEGRGEEGTGDKGEG